MSFDVLNRYSGSHKPWDHVGNIIPDVEHSEGERPAVQFKVAPWLPVQFFDKYYENYIVVMPGKPVALDPDGYVMPAEYGLTSASVTYTANDVAQGTIDIATGLPVTTPKVVTLSNLSGVKDGTWTRDNAGVTAVTSGFMGTFGRSFGDSAKKYPIGVAPYAYLQWAGGDGSNPAGYKFHNYNMQHQVAVLCDYVIKLPLIPATVTSEAVAKTVTNSNLVFGTAHVHTRAYAGSNATGRYAAAGTYPLTGMTVVAVALDKFPVATQTLRTVISLASDNTADDLSGILLNERSSLSAVKQAGDYWVDYPVGVVFLYSADGATLPVALSGAAGNVTVKYAHNDAAASTLSKFACVLGATGAVQPGDFLKCGTGSNLVQADPSTDNFASIVGQVIGVEKHPLDGLDRVKTAFNPPIGTDASGSLANGTAGSASAGLGQMDRMPGSATGGMPDMVNMSGAADTVLIINLVSR